MDSDWNIISMATYCSQELLWFRLLDSVEGFHVIPFVSQFSCAHSYLVCCTLLPVKLSCSSCPLSPCGPETALICHMFRVHVRAPATGLLWFAHSTSLGVTCYNYVSTSTWFISLHCIPWIQSESPCRMWNMSCKYKNIFLVQLKFSHEKIQENIVVTYKAI